MRSSLRLVQAVVLVALMVQGASHKALAQGMYTPQACCEAAPCVTECCDPCGCAGPRCYGSVELLWWWLKGDEVPPLVTRDDLLIEPPVAGSLANPNTTVLLGGELDTDPQAGTRITIGRWLSNDQSLALEGSIFWLAEGSRSHAFFLPGEDNLGAPTLFRPFFNVTVGEQDSLFIAGPLRTGGVGVDFGQRLMGAELNGRTRARDTGRLRVDLLAGFRFLALDEHLDIFTSSIDVPGGEFINQQSFESFATRNRFYGGQVGADIRYAGDLWWVGGLIKLAIGGSHQQTDISGNAVDNVIGVSGPQTLFAQTTNIGTHERGQFVFVPELGVTFGLRLLDNVDLTIGYTLIWISDVVRPGSAIDFSTTAPVIGELPTSSTDPAFTFQSDDFWAQGINLGVEIRY